MVSKAQFKPSIKKEEHRESSKTTESPKLLAEIQPKNKQSVCGDREDSLKDESGKEVGNLISMSTSKGQIKCAVIGRWNEQGNVKMLLLKLEKGRNSINEHVLAV